jgi:uncharacterized C2H2 Zn-finger protein
VECDICLDSFQTAELLQEHVKEEHLTGNNKCETCGKIFQRPDHLKRHVQSVHEKKKQLKQQVKN